MILKKEIEINRYPRNRPMGHLKGVEHVFILWLDSKWRSIFQFRLNKFIYVPFYVSKLSNFNIGGITRNNSPTHQPDNICQFIYNRFFMIMCLFYLLFLQNMYFFQIRRMMTSPLYRKWINLIQDLTRIPWKY